MVFLVLPLKAPVARMVIRERMDYKDYLGGSLKDELDGLDRLEGKFVINAVDFKVMFSFTLREEHLALAEVSSQPI